jgi:hypothetical protein
VVQETHRKNILTVKPFGNINFNLCSSAKELFVHSDIIDQIGGWSSSSVGASYGKGYELPVLAKWMTMLEDE